MFSPLELPNDSIWKLARSSNYIVHMNLNCSSCLHSGLARLLQKGIGSQSEQQVSQDAFESQLPPQPMIPLPNTLLDTSAAQEGKKIEEKQDTVDSLKSK